MNAQTGIALAKWQRQKGRRGLPWLAQRDPYKIWLAEVMLQQTQVSAAAPYYLRFVRRFPSVAALARAREDSVMAAWSGLGYYRRAANLHRAAKIIHAQGFPQTFDEWHALPGVGKSTAGAISVFALGERRAILDGNAKRVLARLFAIDKPINAAQTQNVLWHAAESILPPQKHIRAHTQGIMDLGATICLRANPLCDKCPLSNQCAARKNGTQNKLPIKTAAKTKPHRKTTMALIQCGGNVLLQKRGNAGVWRGLWSLPENETPQTLRKQWRKQLPGLRLQKQHSTLRHEFTHYALTAEVLHFTCPQKTPGEWRWHPQHKLKQTALPAPIRKLLSAQSGGS